MEAHHIEAGTGPVVRNNSFARKERGGRVLITVALLLILAAAGYRWLTHDGSYVLFTKFTPSNGVVEAIGVTPEPAPVQTVPGEITPAPSLEVETAAPDPTLLDNNPGMQAPTQPAATQSPATPRVVATPKPLQGAPLGDDPQNTTSAAPVPDTVETAAIVEAEQTDPVPAENIEDVVVRLHVPTGVPSNEMDQVMSVLRQAGYTTEGPIPADVTVSTSNARFFYPEDENRAADLVKQLTGSGDIAVRPRNFSHLAAKPRIGVIELWLAGSPTRSGTTRQQQNGRATPSGVGPAISSQLRSLVEQVQSRQ